ncbi:MAG TPA: SLC13 family permease [Nocardioides sp.]|nr:SLC13 family permease [Nocardioides sp.]
MPPPLSDVVVVLALVGMLIVAFGHPRGRVEVAMGVACAGATVATGILTLDEARAAVDHLAPVVAFLVTILVVSDVCARSGVFDAAARRVSRWSGPSAVRLFTGVFVLAAVVTATLSLDATVVLLTPVVLAAAMARAVPGTPATYACLRMANSASLLLPVSNLTNLLALPHLDLTFTGFAARMAPVLAVVLVVEYVGLRLIFREALAATPATADAPLRPVPRFPVAVVALMLLGFALVSPFGGDPWWASLVAAAALAAYAVRRGLARPIHLVHAAHPGFAFWVLALGVVVAGLAHGFLGHAVRDLAPASTGLGALLVVAVLATVLANLLTNLSATLLLVPVVAPLGTSAVLAALLGLNIGSGLTWTGSLANLLWRRTLGRHGVHPTSAAFHRVSLTLTPVSLLAAVVVLWAVT